MQTVALSNEAARRLTQLSKKFGVNEEELAKLLLVAAIEDEEFVLRVIKSMLGTEPEDTTPG